MLSDFQASPSDIESSIQRVRAIADTEIRRDPRSNFPLVLLGYPEREIASDLETKAACVKLDLMLP